MNVFKRGMIFLTFIGSCFAIALLVASLGTKQWINAKAKRTSNPHESDGKIQFGLFDGRKELNVAYGWRTYEIDSKYFSFFSFLFSKQFWPHKVEFFVNTLFTVSNTYLILQPVPFFFNEF